MPPPQHDEQRVYKYVRKNALLTSFPEEVGVSVPTWDYHLQQRLIAVRHLWLGCLNAH